MNVLRDWLILIQRETIQPQELIDNFDLDNLRKLKEKAEAFMENIEHSIATYSLPEGVSPSAAEKHKNQVATNLEVIDNAIESANLNEDLTLSGHSTTFWKN